MHITINKKNKKRVSTLFSALGAFGMAAQNYFAVDMALRAMISGMTSIPRYIAGLIQAVAIGAGGVCSGMVNYFINLELLDGFLDRITSTEPSKKLTGWRKFRYYAGTLVFAMTGVLFGLMAFTFSATGPLLAVGIAAGVFVAIIMTIQEIETWLQSFDGPDAEDKKSLIEIFKEWKSTLTLGKLCGHVIAAGNVIALSLLFTAGLAEVLVVMGVAAFPAFVIGVSVAFTFGAFTEFYFYNFFLSKFCAQFKANWEAMKATHYAPVGFLCISTNALVNSALTFSGVCLLSGAVALAGIGLPPVGLIMALAAVSAVFAGAASFVLGMDFWIRKQGICVTVVSESPEGIDVSSISLGGFREGYVLFKNHAGVQACYYVNKKESVVEKLAATSDQLNWVESSLLGSKSTHPLSQTALAQLKAFATPSAPVVVQPDVINSTPHEARHYTKGLSIYETRTVVNPTAPSSSAALAA